MRHSKKYPNAIHDHEIEVMVKNVAFIGMLASHMGPTFKPRENIVIIIIFISYIQGILHKCPDTLYNLKTTRYFS